MRKEIDIGYDNETLKQLIVQLMIEKRYNKVAVKDFIQNQFGYDSFKGKNYKGERKKIEDRFKELERKKIVLSTLNQTQKYTKTYWRTEFVKVGEKEMERMYEEEVKSERKSSDNKYILNRNIQIKDKKYNSNDLKKISLLISKMYDDEDKFSSNYVNEIINDLYGNDTKEIKQLVSNIGLSFSHITKTETQSTSLDSLLSLIELNSKVKISINNGISNMNLDGVILNSIVFGKKSFEMVFENISIKLKDISEIQSLIGNSYPLDYENIVQNIKNDISRLKSIISEYPSEDTTNIEKFIQSIENPLEVFLQ